MNQQNNPNDLNQNQRVVLKLRYNPNKKYTLRMRLLPDIMKHGISIQETMKNKPIMIWSRMMEIGSLFLPKNMLKTQTYQKK